MLIDRTMKLVDLWWKTRSCSSHCKSKQHNELIDVDWQCNEHCWCLMESNNCHRTVNQNTGNDWFWLPMQWAWLLRFCSETQHVHCTVNQTKWNERCLLTVQRRLLVCAFMKKQQFALYCPSKWDERCWSIAQWQWYIFDQRQQPSSLYRRKTMKLMMLTDRTMNKTHC